MFTDEQKKLLQKPLSPDRIKQRQQSGMNLSYLEGWDAIGIANQIFGFDGWSSDVVDLTHIATDEYQGRNKTGWQTAYRATVKVSIDGQVHSDCGFGNGISYANAIESHEMAEKEAVTDALKRALRHWGDQFGLCLYDKEQRGVGYEDEQPGAKPSPGVQARMKREPNESAPMQGKKEPSTPAPELVAADESAVADYYAYITEHGVDPGKAGEQIENARVKYGGIIPAAWLEHMLTQAKLKFGDRLNPDE